MRSGDSLTSVFTGSTNTVSVLVALLLTCHVSSPAMAEPPLHVHVRSEQQGQGLLILRLNTCYTITAGHVLGTSRQAELVGGQDGRLLGDGDVVHTFEGEDVALLRVTGALARRCGTEFEDVRQLDRLVATRAQATLSYVFDDGGVGRMPVVVTDVGPHFMRVRPTNVGDRLMQGLSGGLITVGDQPAGLLLSVESGGNGKAIRYDRVTTLIRQFFAQPPVAAPTPIERRLGMGADLLAARHRFGLREKVGARLSPPVPLVGVMGRLGRCCHGTSEGNEADEQ